MRCLGSVVIDSADPAALQEFWSALLEQPLSGDTAEEFGVLLGEDAFVIFAPADDRKQGKNRVHLDLASTSDEHQAALVARACSLGAAPVDIGQGATPWVVLADPEGNEFCVLEPRDEYLGIGPVAAVVVDAHAPSALAAFWSHATGLPVTREHPVYASIRQESAFSLEFIRVTEPKSSRNRVRIGIPPDLDLASQIAQLEGWGAMRVGADLVKSGEQVALADPERNEFSIMARR